MWAQDARRHDSGLIQAYECVAADYFEPPPVGSRYKEFYKWLELLVKRHTRGNSVLDVGCGDGLFLATISQEWLKYGLEPSSAGAELARKRDLNVSCGTLENPPQDYEVDLLCALDVIEHVIDPHSFIDSLKKQLRPGGIVLILTGDSTSLPARVAGAQWSYLKWCGHVSIFSEAGLRRVLLDHGFEVVDWKRCQHPSSPGLIAWWRVHLLEPARRALGRNKSWYPFWRDHQAVIARLV